MDNRAILATGTLAELNERYGLFKNAPLDVLTDTIEAAHHYRGKLVVKERQGVYTIAKETNE